MFLGIYGIDEYVAIPAVTHKFSTGAAFAPSAITYSIYEEGSTTGTDEDVDMTPASPFDSVVGLYYARRQLTAAAGFEANKTYIVVVKATVDSVAAIDVHVFQIRPLQTGDSYARLGAPAGASISADVAAVKGETASILADTGTDGVVLAADAITAAKIADNAFANEHFAAGALTSAEITSAAGCAVASIANDAIKAATIENGAIDSATFAANAITSTVIADDAITAAKINTGAITADAFAADAIVAATLATDCITDDAIATGAIASTAFAAGAITNAAVADDVDVNAKTVTSGIIATDVWNALTASYGGAGTYGQAVEDTLADTNELQSDDYPTSIAAVKAVVDLTEDILRNKMEITDADGALVLRADNNTDVLYTVAACITDNSTTTIRKRIE